MKYRVLNFGVPAVHELITPLPSLSDLLKHLFFEPFRRSRSALKRRDLCKRFYEGLLNPSAT